MTDHTILYDGNHFEICKIHLASCSSLLYRPYTHTHACSHNVDWAHWIPSVHHCVYFSRQNCHNFPNIVVRSYLMLIWTFCAVWPLTYEENDDDDDDDVKSMYARECIWKRTNEWSASIWHANEDYDHKRKLVTILAYWASVVPVIIYSIAKFRIITDTRTLVQNPKHNTLGPDILSKSQYPKGKQWQITAVTYIDDEIVNIYYMVSVCVYIVWLYLARNSQSPFRYCLCVFC